MSAPLRVALVHYHLRPGGVTTVLRHAAAALAERGAACVVLAGAPPSAPAWPAPVVPVPGLDYGGTDSPEALRAALARAAQGALGAAPDVWYVHNHALGRNRALPGAVRLLADAGAALLLQPHDFAEDGRPAFYRDLLAAAGSPASLARLAYPVGPRVHYAALTRSLAALLSRAGAPPEVVHHLPNPVLLDGPPPGPPRGHGHHLYPTRAIRRKNLGEFLLWSAVAPACSRWAVTLAPRSAADAAPYAEWVAFARGHRLPVDFEVGAGGGRTLAELLGDADVIHSCSVAEGFGLAFLEPWLADRPVLGRDLPEVTADFRVAGVHLDHLYARLDVPLGWAGGRDAFAGALAAGLRDARAAYGRATAPADVAAAFDAAVRGDAVDFGCLDEPLQQRVIRHLLDAPADWHAAAPAAVSAPAIEANRLAISSAFGAAACGDRLLAACHAAAGARSGPCASLDGKFLLDHFLQPQRFRLLRS